MDGGAGVEGRDWEAGRGRRERRERATRDRARNCSLPAGIDACLGQVRVQNSCESSSAPQSRSYRSHLQSRLIRDLTRAPRAGVSLRGGARWWRSAAGAGMGAASSAGRYSSRARAADRGRGLRQVGRGAQGAPEERPDARVVLSGEVARPRPPGAPKAEKILTDHECRASFTGPASGPPLVTFPHPRQSRHGRTGSSQQRAHR